MAKTAKKNARKTAPPLGRPRAAQPSDRVIPGLEQARNARLDDLCQKIADTRATQNQCVADAAGFAQAALIEMQRDKRRDPKGTFAYRCAGVELVRVVGAEKLSIKTSRDKSATSEVAGDETDGEGQGPGSYPVEPIE